MSQRRKPGAGLLRQRKDGRWEGRIVVGYDDNGLPKTKNVLAKTKKECQTKLKELQQSLPPPAKALPKQCSPEMPFGDWLRFWYEQYEKPALRPTTRMGYENSIYKHIIPALGETALCELTQSDLHRFYGDLKQSGRLRQTERFGNGLSDRSVRACHAVIRMALDRAEAEKLISTNPAAACKLPPKRGKEMQVLNREELQRFLIQAREEGFYEMAVLELATGMRRGELCALQWNDLDLTTGALQIQRQVYRADGKLVVSQPKTRSSIRTVLLPPAVLDLLKTYRERSNSKWLFPSPVNEDVPVSPDAVRKKLKRVLEHANCKTIRFHDLRHTFATAALEHGMDVKTLSAIIGHISSATTLNIYSHVTDQMKRQAARKIDAGIAGACEPPDSALSGLPLENEPQTQPQAFTPYKGKYRKPGTGCLYQINDHLWEGKYSPKGPDGKRIRKNVYAPTREECETKLAAMIAETKAEIAEKQKKT